MTYETNPPRPPRQDDAVFAALVEIVDRVRGESIGVTIWVPGGVVSGQLVGEHEYLGAIAEQLGEVWGKSNPVRRVRG